MRSRSTNWSGSAGPLDGHEGGLVMGKVLDKVMWTVDKWIVKILLLTMFGESLSDEEYERFWA